MPTTLGRLILGLAAAVIIWTGLERRTPAAQAQDDQFEVTFVPLSAAVPAVLYRPRSAGDRSRIGLLVMHPFASYLTHPACSQMALRGYSVLCANPHTVNLGHSAYTIEEQAPDVALAVKFLRDQSDIQRVVLVGHSAAGPLLSFYQNVAQNGHSVCQGPEKLYRCPDSLAGLPAADGLVLLDAHGGYGFAGTTYLDPALTSDTNVRQRSAALDMWTPANGFNTSTGEAQYSPEFVKAFSAAQSSRNNRLIDGALERLARIQSGTSLLTDDEPFVVFGTNSRLWQPDLRLQSRTRQPHTLLHADGSVDTTIVQAVRLPSGSASAARSYDSAGVGVSVRQFLSSNAVRTTPDYEIGEDFIAGVDWASSSSSTPWNVERISVPLLVASMTAHYFMVVDEIIFDHAASPDKQLAYVEGASHNLTTCKACERTPNQYGETQQTLFTYLDSWLTSRYL